MNAPEKRYLEWLAQKLREVEDPGRVPIDVTDRMEAVAFRLMRLAGGAQVEFKDDPTPPYHWLGKDAE